MEVLGAFDLAILKPKVISILHLHGNIKISYSSIFRYFLYFNRSIIPLEILATLCCAIHGSINSKCTSRERRGSKHDEGLRKIYSEKRKERRKERKREKEKGNGEKQKGKKEERNVAFRKLSLPRRATISLRPGNFYDEATRAGRGNTQGDEVLSTCNTR